MKADAIISRTLLRLGAQAVRRDVLEAAWLRMVGSNELLWFVGEGAAVGGGADLDGYDGGDAGGVVVSQGLDGQLLGEGVCSHQSGHGEVADA